MDGEFPWNSRPAVSALTNAAPSTTSLLCRYLSVFQNPFVVRAKRESPATGNARRFARTDDRIRIAKNYYYFIFLIALRCRDAATRVGKMSFQ
jgi:hypothetical protein